MIFFNLTNIGEPLDLKWVKKGRFLRHMTLCENSRGIWEGGSVGSGGSSRPPWRRIVNGVGLSKRKEKEEGKNGKISLKEGKKVERRADKKADKGVLSDCQFCRTQNWV